VFYKGKKGSPHWLLTHTVRTVSMSATMSEDLRGFDEAAATLKEAGVVLLPSVLSSEETDGILNIFKSLSPKVVVKRRIGREDWVLDAQEEALVQIASRKMFAGVVSRVLGARTYVEKAGILKSNPGAIDQRFHMDTPHLFSIAGLHLPAHSLNCFIATIDIAVENGPTEFQVGTHKKENLALPKKLVQACVPKGSLVFYDTRIVHRGTKNASLVQRDLPYLTFSRAWYRDVVNP